jgi:hypothetical protein
MMQRPNDTPRRPDAPVIPFDRLASGRALQAIPATERRSSGGARHRGLFLAGLVLVSPVILLGLLAVFVAWLIVFGAIGTAIVASDLVRAAFWLVRVPIGALGLRAADYPAGP